MLNLEKGDFDCWVYIGSLVQTTEIMSFYVFQQVSKPATLAFSSQSVQDLPFPDRFYPDPEKLQKKLRALRAFAVPFFSESPPVRAWFCSDPGSFFKDQNKPTKKPPLRPSRLRGSIFLGTNKNPS